VAARRDDAGMSTSTQTPTTTAARAVAATKVYGSGDTAVVALDDMTLDLPTGRFTAIMGPSGSGKSTLVHCLAGLDRLTEGQVLVGDRLGHRPSELSGGQQQRVAVARALVSRPAIVFADEPTGNLDSRGGAELLNFLRRAVDQTGQTVVMVTHDPGAAAHADAVVFLADGRLAGHLANPTAERVLDTIKRLGS
jgi:putative ABC transport system ATP-binding protein